MFIHACHCRDCQVQVGGPFAINGIIEARHVKQTRGPKPKRYTVPTESGRPHDIYRCPKCATALWSDYGRRKVILFVRMATLLGPKGSGGKAAAKLTNPDVHIFTRSRLPCDQLVMTGALPSGRAASAEAPAKAGAANKRAGAQKDAKSQWSSDAPLGHTTVRGSTTKKPAGVFSVYYDMQKEWPAASLKRREACLAKMKK
jgi:hypothetical protein